jgi:hypothetical protein
MKKFLISFFFLTCIFVNSSSSSITKYFGSSKIKLDEIGVVNFIRYLEGRFYSEDRIVDRAAQMSPMYYAISEDGKIGYGWFCDSYRSEDCADDFSAYRVVEYCKEYAKQNCAIFAYRNEIVWGNANISVDDLGFKSNIELFKKLGFLNSETQKSNNKVNEKNYYDYVRQTVDKCSSKIDLTTRSNLRGAGLDCLVPGRYEMTINQKANTDTRLINPILKLKI